MKLAVIVGSVLFLATAGCATAAGPANNNEDAGPPASSDAGKDSGLKKTFEAGSPHNDAASTTGNDASTPPTDSTCSAETTKANCEQCCLTVHPTGYQTYHATLQNCACTSPASCATECATELCVNQPTTSGGACETCITASLTQSTGACYSAIATSCQSDVDCTALFSTCIPPCESK